MQIKIKTKMEIHGKLSGNISNIKTIRFRLEEGLQSDDEPRYFWRYLGIIMCAKIILLLLVSGAFMLGCKFKTTPSLTPSLPTTTSRTVMTTPSDETTEITSTVYVNHDGILNKLDGNRSIACCL